MVAHQGVKYVLNVYARSVAVNQNASVRLGCLSLKTGTTSSVSRSKAEA
jgi:hypothetical protein